jgi:hypothetical protein
MNERIEPADAAHALSEIDRRREQVIRRKVFPGWWWFAVGGPMFVRWEAAMLVRRSGSRR